MNNTQYLLTKLAEEASEITKIALKTAQFGPTERMLGQSFTNYERCHQELDDLVAIIAMLNKECGFNYHTNIQATEGKIAKVNKYREYSTHLGLVDKQ